ncbi:MAG: thioredoxin family protein [Granulosicoccus sp.]
MTKHYGIHQSIRRRLLTAFATTLLLPLSVFAAEGTKHYEPGLVETELAAGNTVLLDFAASWCGTCKRQDRVISKLRSDNTAYNENIIFIRVDWDTYSDHEISIMNNIPRRSTLILLRGDEELGRIVAGTSEAQIKALMDLGLST